MMKEKGVYILLDAILILKERGLLFECHFVGKWADIHETDFLNYVVKNGLQSFAVAHGARYNEEKMEYFSAADAFVFPTFYHGEAFPLVLLEAMQFGLPCISTHEGGIESIVDDNETGFLIEPGQAHPLAEKMELLIHSPELGRKMGEAGRTRFEENFTLKEFEYRFVDILQQALRN
jgi:glycosyltransferase involved in cell wall biosynthesis